MFRKILIANRGEIACRVIETAKKMGIATVAVYSEADAQSKHVRLADEAICLGSAALADSYLNIDSVLKAIHITAAQAVHPGYGFLSENAQFCKRCEESGVTFIGPSAHAIEMMGSKSLAKTTMSKANVPLIPGYHGVDQTAEGLKTQAGSIGYPVLIKAVAGGGGKGMRIVNSNDEFVSALSSAKREAASSFANDEVLIEKYLIQPRHVEIQVFCDKDGNAVHLFERDCSMQRRHQKIVEEAPAPGISDELREKMGRAAIDAARAINYVGAGTVEFLLDPRTSNFYFMEMNTRLQVEHPVTEMVSGIDLVEWQLRVAAGQQLPLTQDSLSLSGHAIEARIYAEDPNNNFYPDTGILTNIQEPERVTGVRLDSGVDEGDEVSVYFDPMLAKLIVYAEHRESALNKLNRALIQYTVLGVKNNIEFLRACINHHAFREGKYSTHFIEEHGANILASIKHYRDGYKQENLNLIALYLILVNESRIEKERDPWIRLKSWRLNTRIRELGDVKYEGERVALAYIESGAVGHRLWHIFIDGESSGEISGKLTGDRLTARFGEYGASLRIVQNNPPPPMSYSIIRADGVFHFSREDTEKAEQVIYEASSDAMDGQDVSAPMNGRVIEVFVKEGSVVKEGDDLLVIEAMKMEHTVKARHDGKVEKILCVMEQLVKGGEQLVQFRK